MKPGGNSMTDKSTNKLTHPSEMKAESKIEFVDRGWLYYHINDFSNSISDFRAALNLDPDDINTMYALGLALKAGGQNEEAKAIFNQVIEHSHIIDRSDRAQILKSLASGHYNQIEKGTW